MREFRLGTRIVDAPVQPVHLTAFEVMAVHVTEAEYAACVADGGCLAAPGQGRADVPQTQVNFADALAYAGWLSGRTSLDWRLPTDAEWPRAAGDRGFDDGFERDVRLGRGAAGVPQDNLDIRLVRSVEAGA